MNYYIIGTTDDKIPVIMTEISEYDVLNFHNQTSNLLPYLMRLREFEKYPNFINTEFSQMITDTVNEYEFNRDKKL